MSEAMTGTYMHQAPKLKIQQEQIAGDTLAQWLEMVSQPNKIAVDLIC